MRSLTIEVVLAYLMRSPFLTDSVGDRSEVVFDALTQHFLDLDRKEQIFRAI